jgi:hypothetical protein
LPKFSTYERDERDGSAKIEQDTTPLNALSHEANKAISNENRISVTSKRAHDFAQVPLVSIHEAAMSEVSKDHVLNSYGATEQNNDYSILINDEMIDRELVLFPTQMSSSQEFNNIRLKPAPLCPELRDRIVHSPSYQMRVICMSHSEAHRDRFKPSTTSTIGKTFAIISELGSLGKKSLFFPTTDRSEPPMEEFDDRENYEDGCIIID